MTAWRYGISLLVLKIIFQLMKRNFVCPRIVDLPLYKIFDNLYKIEPSESQKCIYKLKNKQTSSTGV